MFYSQFILAKKGPLGTIWIAAHLERKLRKNQVADTDIGVSVDSIIFPEVPIALRLSSHLLLGVVRIYSKKVNYLFDDCSDALLKVRQAFRSTAVDLPPEESKAPYHSITLPETFDLDDFELPDNELLQGNFDHHVSAREHITLQDTLDGATLSTSKFGLDERFGDGDASQIGLDLDEALFANKGEASEHGDPSGLSIDAEAAIETDAPLRTDEHTEGNSEASRATSANYSSIQAPCTPGLMEEPDLPGAQDALISDDHMDEDNNPNGLMEKEIIENASVHAGPCQTDFDMVQPFAKADVCQEEMQETVLKENSPLATELMDSMPTDDAQNSPLYKQAPASNGSEGRSTFQNGIYTNNESNITFPVHSEIVCGESNVFGINGFASENDLITKNHSLLVPGSDTCIDNGVDTSSHTDLCSPPFVSKSVDAEVSLKSVPAEVSLKSVPTEVCKDLDNNIADSGSIGCHPCSKLDNSENLSVHMHGSMLSPSAPVLRACNSHPNSEADNLVSTTNLPPEEVGLSSTDNLVGATNLTSEDVRLHTETAPWQDFMEANTSQLMNTHGDHDSAYQKEETIILQDAQLGKEKSDIITNLPSPEKMLSVPFVAPTKATELVESTPEKEAAVEENKLISGKKRSYTESTLTVQSLNSVESPGAAQSKRSSDFIPDDDDLLSSILVGRRSTALKLKPTPPAPEMAVTKRPRLAVRASAYKRKVLVDDTMVLHGDNIRQQLMNVEDIRRVRKKAPCTRPEIWMLQKQFLEEEIFSEPIFIGMSRVLMNLHREPFDLSGTKIIQAESKSHPMEETELETHVSQTVGQVPVFEGYDLASVVRDDQAPCPQTLLNTQNLVSIKPISVDVAAEPRDITRIDAAAAYNHVERDASGHTAEVAIDSGKVLAEDQASFSQNQVSIKPMSVDAAAEPRDVTRIDAAAAAAAAYNHPERDASGHTPEVAIDSGKVLSGDQTGRSVSFYFELSTSVGPMSEENRNLIDSSMIRSDCLDESNDAPLQSCVPSETHNQNLDVHRLGHYTSYIKNALEETNDGDADVSTGEVLNQDEQCRGEDDQFSKKMEGIGALATEVGVLPESSSVCDAKISAETALQGAFDANGVQVIEGEVGVSVLKEDESLASDVRYDERSPTSNDFLCGVQKLDSSYEADLNMKHPILVDGEHPECQQAHSEILLDATINIPEHFRTEDYGDFGADDAEHDTDFLNVDDDDDDEMNEADDNSMPNNQETRMLDNSGWSGRTRAVANYLQALFNKEVQHGTKVLQMDNLLTGKTRKEASRMFFETLVLKTKDYIHVEQPNAYDNVNIKPRVKLMKSEF